jgi:pimeloyl-ACP methyl ester carboxylesterase
VLTAVGLTAACAASATAATSSRGAERPAPATMAVPAQVPKLHWTSCYGGFQCATARVPLDYRHQDGTKISIAVVRHVATDPAKRIGSLFVNGGGPTEQIAGFLATYPGLPAILRQRFDIITFDPRGFGLSTAVRCFTSTAAEQQFLSGLPAFPVGARQESAWERTWAAFDTRCARHANTGLLDHDTTADVARDMNLLREAVGERQLNFAGLSYGTGLGAVYANLFPAAVGRMVLDANLNPVAWTKPDGSLTTFLRLHSDQANAADLRAFLRLCGRRTTTRCAFSAGTPSATQAKWATLLRRMKRHPVTAGNPPQTYTYADAIESVPLSTVSAWQQGARLLQQLWAASAGRTATPAAPADSVAAAPAVYTGQEQGLAVLCSDSPNPRNLSAYAADARLAFARSGAIGLGWVWPTVACARWPGHGAADRYTGPWNRPTAHTILLLGNTGDAVLPYRDTVAMEHDLARARLLTVAEYGHTELNNPSSCAVVYELSYLLTGSLPPAGTVCQPDAGPFPAP